MVGVRRAGFILAINSDPDALIFASADVGIVGDWREVVPILAATLEAGTAASPGSAGAEVGTPLAPGQVPSLDLTGRTAVITGAARGIGRACAELFAACGCAVAVCDLRGEELAVVESGIRERGGAVLAMRGRCP